MAGTTGLAVYMEDQAYNGRQGGPWANDFKTLNFQRSKETQLANFSSTNMFGVSAVPLPRASAAEGSLCTLCLDQFMQDGSLASMEGRGQNAGLVFQAYAIGALFCSIPPAAYPPSNRMQFEQFTRLIAQGEQVRDPRSGFPRATQTAVPFINRIRWKAPSAALTVTIPRRIF